MDQWEYISTFLTAEAKEKNLKEWIETHFDKKARRFSPEAMIPNLNKFGADGWELMHIEPVSKVGRNEKVQDDPYAWSNTYFCVFKRRKLASNSDSIPTNDDLPPPQTPTTPNDAE